MNVVTGATGLLGSHLLYALTRRGEKCRAVYRDEKRIQQVRQVFTHYAAEQSEDLLQLVEWCKGDILDIPFLEEIIQEGDRVYHCAAIVSFDKKDFKQMIRVNRYGTENVVNVCLAKNAKKLCHVSSTAAIGSGKDPIDESCMWKNGPEVSGYSVSKYSAEKEVWRGIEEGLDAVMVNPCVIFGAGNWNDSSLAIFKNVAKGNRFYPTGSNATVDARDVAEIMIRLMHSDISAQRYLCIGSNQSLKELMTVIAEEIGVRPPSKAVSKTFVNTIRLITSFFVFFIGKRPPLSKENVNSLFGHRRYSAAKIERELDFTFRPLAEQVQNAVAGKVS